ncbi:MAG: zinc-binding dehydrogenase [Bacteroidota bacterium]
MRSTAVVFTAPGTVEVLPVDCPDPGPADVVVRVTHSWISNGTEGSYLRGERSDGDTPFAEGDPLPFPVVAGYQKIGIIDWVGDEIDDLAVGETVFCTIGRVEGMHHGYAGHVSPSVCGRGDVWKLPAGVDPLAFAPMVLAQVGYNGGIRPEVRIGDVAVVVGDGMVGHWTAQTLAWRGAEVVLVGRHPDRLRRFASPPYRHTVDARQTDWAGWVTERFGTANVVVDTVGSIDVMETAQGVLQRFGHLVSAGFYGSADRLRLQPPRYGELHLHLVSGWWPDRMEHTLRLIAGGHLDTLSLLTHRFPVAQAAQAWALIEDPARPALGVVLDWE